MRTLLAVFKKKWVITVIGLLALSAIVWFGGPLVSIAGVVPLRSAIVRVAIIVVLLLIGAISILRIRVAIRRADETIAGTAAADAGSAAGGESVSAAEMGALKARFDEALSLLRKSDAKRGGRSLYELPWYVIIGPPGSGKTTALVNSGLDFPLAERFGNEALRGIGGTRNCDWWFTNDAVLIDTAGRYVTQDSDASVDSAAWAGFLGLLRKYRRRRPINGALIAISIADLMGLSESQRAGHIHAIRQRIQELHKILGIRFPVYLLFTKCDLIAGFMEFYDDLGREDRAQVWGITFPITASEAGQAAAQFDSAFDGLMQRLGQRVLWRLNQERDPQRRALIQGFPAQVAALRTRIGEFTRSIFQTSRYEETPLLRGVYFTSGTQEGTPIDRLINALSRSFGLEQRVLPTYGGQGRSYFIRELLSQVIFPEADLAGSNRRLELQRAWLQWAAYVGVLVVAGLAALLWSVSFARNELYVLRMERQVAQYRQVASGPLPAMPSLGEILPRLDALRAATKIYDFKDGAPWTMGLGLYQGGRLGGAAQRTYYAALNSLLEPHLVSEATRALSQPGASPQFLYETLKQYLMLTQPDKLDPDFTQLWYRLDWQHAGTLTSDQIARLKRHLAYLLKQGIAPVSPDAGLVRQVRDQLAQTSLAERMYARLKSDAELEGAAAFTVAAAIPGANEVFTEAGGKLTAAVPGIYTRQGYEQVIKPAFHEIGADLAEDNWVMGTSAGPLDPQARRQAREAVEELYFNDYIAKWQNLLDVLQVRQFYSVAAGASDLAVVAGPSSPMIALLLRVAKETTLVRPRKGPGKLGQLAAHTAASRGRLARLFGFARGTSNGSDAVRNSEQSMPAAVVSQHFSALNALSTSSAGGQPPIAQIKTSLSQLQGYLQQVASSGGQSAQQAAQSQVQGGGIVAEIRTLAVQQPQPVHRWLDQLADVSNSAVLAGAAGNLDQAYSAKVVSFYQQAVAGRYPFDNSTTIDVSMDDFGQFFGPGGAMDKFFRQDLKPFVDTDGRFWRSVRSGPPLSPEVLADFQLASRVRRAFFANGGARPAFSFGIKPVYLDANVNRALLDIDGQSVSYRHGPIRVSAINWPGDLSNSGMTLTFTTASGGQVSTSASGSWALFRFLSKGRIRELSADHFLVTWTIGGYKAQYEIIANSVNNPFVLFDELMRFRCPEHL